MVHALCFVDFTSAKASKAQPDEFSADYRAQSHLSVIPHSILET